MSHKSATMTHQKHEQATCMFGLILEDVWELMKLMPMHVHPSPMLIDPSRWISTPAPGRLTPIKQMLTPP